MIIIASFALNEKDRRAFRLVIPHDSKTVCHAEVQHTDALGDVAWIKWEFDQNKMIKLLRLIAQECARFVEPNGVRVQIELGIIDLN